MNTPTGTQNTITIIQNTWHYAMTFGVPDGTDLNTEQQILMTELHELLPELCDSDLHRVLTGHMHCATDYPTNLDFDVPF